MTRRHLLMLLTVAPAVRAMRREEWVKVTVLVNDRVYRVWWEPRARAEERFRSVFELTRMRRTIRGREITVSTVIPEGELRHES